ncbi:MAG: hypothetical protein V7K94_03175 [Nostoc sp.]|uniref:hypothetical protein n=1 Tax=Nostoc sp. TaxID=1180 RepID=UPI002FF7A8C4
MIKYHSNHFGVASLAHNKKKAIQGLSEQEVLLNFSQKKPPEDVSLPGELVIRVHLPINCSQVEHRIPDKFG